MGVGGELVGQVGHQGGKVGKVLLEEAGNVATRCQVLEAVGGSLVGQEQGDRECFLKVGQGDEHEVTAGADMGGPPLALGPPPGARRPSQFLVAAHPGVEGHPPPHHGSELTARANDEGWETVFAGFLKVSQANDKDAVLVFSVGGGNAEKNVSVNIIRVLEEAKKRGMKIFGVVGRDGGYTKQVGDEVVVVPTVEPGLVTPLTEAFQAVVWHGIVSHDDLQIRDTKW